MASSERAHAQCAVTPASPGARLHLEIGNAKESFHGGLLVAVALLYTSFGLVPTPMLGAEAYFRTLKLNITWNNGNMATMAATAQRGERRGEERRGGRADGWCGGRCSVRSLTPSVWFTGLSLQYTLLMVRERKNVM